MKEKEFVKIRNISKTYPGVKALSNVDMTVLRGEVHGLIGENGAGKSTLIKILTGVNEADEGGEIIIDGEKIEKYNPKKSVEKGVAVIYQDFSLFPNLTVAENIYMSQQIESNHKIVNWRKMKRVSMEAVQKLGVDIDVNKQLGDLSIAKQQLVAICCAIAQDAQMIIMDEPTSSLSKSEVKLLFDIIKDLIKDNIAVVFVSHKMDELFEIADRFTVLRDGEFIATMLKDEIDEAGLIKLMVGREVQYTKYEGGERKDCILELQNFSQKGCFSDINLKLHKGEIIGITGLVGAGRTELAETIFGIEQPDSGTIKLEGERVNIESPSKAIKLGMAFVPESRKTQGLVLEGDMTSNIALPVIEKFSSKFGLIDKKKTRKNAELWIENLDIRPPIPEYITRQLSGGNQQKVIIAKWLSSEPKILIVDEPTNGVDIGAKSEIHKTLRGLAKKGIGIIVISSELPEILAVSDRIFVMKKGRISAEFNDTNISQEEIMNAAL